MKRFYKDERGSSLVLTIIAMTFISLLAVAVIAMTVTNIRLKIAQKGSQKNFYNTDSIMDEVRAGVEDLVAEASMDAYTEAFTNYNASLSGASETLSDKYEKKFLEKMIDLLSDGEYAYGNTDIYYKDEVLQSYLIKVGGGNVADRYLPHDGSKAPGYKDTGSGKTYGYLELQNNTLLLKDVMVTMTEGLKDYKTTLTSDIRVTIPPMTAETYSEYLNYALIADNQIIADNNASVEGNMYAGTVKRFNAGATNPETGILVHSGKVLNVQAEQLITRGDLVLAGGSTFSLDGFQGNGASLWVENIFTKGNSRNVITMSNTVCNVSDDMEIGGKNDVVTLSGQYLGYNYNANYADGDLATTSKDSQYSSSILINGLGADLNLSGLNQLILSGRTFISKKTAGSTETDPATVNNKDIAMGESLSVKGAQIAYYVPSDFVSISTSASAPAGGSGVVPFHMDTDLNTYYTFDYGKYTKYLFGLDPDTATDAELSNAGGNNFDITQYLNMSQPLVKYYRHDTSVQTDSITYYYLNFKNDTKMMEFYPNFQSIVPRYSTVKDANAAYMGSTGISFNASMNIYSYSGNILYRDPSSNDTKVEMGNESNVADSQTLHKYARDKSVEYLSRQLSLVESYQTASDMTSGTTPQYRLLNADVNLSKSGTKDHTNLYNVLIDVTEMATKTGLERKTNDSNTGVVIIEPRANETYTWNDTEKTSLGNLDGGIIIAAGNVKVEKDFSGLIIAGGDITLSSDNVKVTSNNVLLEKMFTEDKSQATPLFYKLFSQYFQKVVNSAIGQEDNAAKDVVFYERWKKE